MLRSQIFTKLTVHRVVCYTPKQIPSLLKVTFDRMIQLAIYEDFLLLCQVFKKLQVHGIVCYTQKQIISL